jgi:hypothetical protein
MGNEGNGEVGSRVGQEFDEKRLSDEVLNQLTEFAITHEARLKTTPKLLRDWLHGEARHPPVVEVAIFAPESGVFSDPAWRVHWGMELSTLFPEEDEPIVPSMSLEEGKPIVSFLSPTVIPKQGRARVLIVFRLLELSQYPNVTEVVGRCVAYPEVAEHFDGVWSRMLATFSPEEGTGETMPARRDGKKAPFPGFPTMEAARNRWRKSWYTIIEKQQEYRRLYEEGETEDPYPSIDDLREALVAMPEWGRKPSATTVRRIIRGGREGLLD